MITNIIDGEKKLSRKIMVTAALPYANGEIHLGHMLEYIQADIWVRYLRMHNYEVYYIGADDAHGTPIMLKAKEQKITPEELIDNSWKDHKCDLDKFSISFDNYYTTHSRENRALSKLIYIKLKKNNLIKTKIINQFYDIENQIFLPDRFIKGTCPKCNAKNQYGDNCESCGLIYQPQDLLNSYSVLSGKPPVLKSSNHYFFCLSDVRCEKFLRNWIKCLAQKEAINKINEWIGESNKSKLIDWDISRDEPYFGFKIPGSLNKYFYVWLDAPIGYYASFRNFAKKNNNINYNLWTKKKSNTEQYHFIGKDILYFHTLFWPAILHFSGHRTPTNIFTHGFLTINGSKMSKSRNTFITAKKYIESKLNPEWLRYYFATKLNSSMEDINLNFTDFLYKVNSDLIGKYINIASRTSSFLTKRFSGVIQDNAMTHNLIKEIKLEIPKIIHLYEIREYSLALKKIMTLTDKVNSYIDSEKPWDCAKNIINNDKLHEICSISLESFRLLSITLKPVLPNIVKNVEQFLSINELKWSDIEFPLTSKYPIKDYHHLVKRINLTQIETLLR